MREIKTWMERLEVKPVNSSDEIEAAMQAEIDELRAENMRLKDGEHQDGLLRVRYAAERDHARACYDKTVRILTGIHALLYPPRFTDNDGKCWEFRSPIAQEQMQELSDRIRALPDELAETDAAMKADPTQSGSDSSQSDSLASHITRSAS